MAREIDQFVPSFMRNICLNQPAASPDGGGGAAVTLPDAEKLSRREIEWPYRRVSIRGGI